MATRAKVESIRKTLPARELPAAWPERAQFGPDELVTVWIEPEDGELARAVSLQGVMDIIGERAKARGLTTEKLDAITNDAQGRYSDQGVARSISRVRSGRPKRLVRRVARTAVLSTIRQRFAVDIPLSAGP